MKALRLWLLRLLAGLSILLLTAALLGGIAWWRARPAPPERQLFIHGTVFTLDAQDTLAEAVLVEHGRISAVGSSTELLSRYQRSAEIHDLHGRALIPGFVDAHSHFPGTGLSVIAVDLNSPPIGTVNTIAQIQERLRNKLHDLPAGAWIFGFGYDDTLLAEHRHPTRAELDAVSTEHPIFITHISGHMGVANSPGLQQAGIGPNTPNPPGGVIVRDAQGSATGLLQEAAEQEALALALHPSALDFVRMVRAAARDYGSQGVTTAQNGATDARSFTGLLWASRLHLVPQRLVVWPVWNGLGRDFLEHRRAREDVESAYFHVGAIKFITDGSIQGYTGFLSHPYHVPYQGKADYRGFPTIDAATLNDWVGRYEAAGFQVALHCNGDAAIDNVLDALQAAQARGIPSDLRPILVHAQMARQDQIQRMKAVSATPSFFAAHTFYWGDRHREIFMGPERAEDISPAAWAHDAGLRFSAHLDSPVVPMNPRLLWWTLVNRRTSSGADIGPAQRLPVVQALRALTLDAAWQLHLEDTLGSIETGKQADLVVLDRDPRLGSDLRALQVDETYVEGRRIHLRDGLQPSETD